MKRQKRIALVNDITGFGRCSVTVELPLISAMKIQACPLPTAILSVHTGFPDHYLDDYTDRMAPYIDSWQRNRLDFDGICTGFLGSAEQIAIVLDFIRPSYTQEMCDKMRSLLGVADLVTPNLTEACQLLDIPYPADGIVTDEELAQMAGALASKGPQQVVITGLHEGETIKNFLYEKGKIDIVRSPKIGGDRSGSGDAFAAIVAASLIRGEHLEAAVRKAASFISKCLMYAVELDLPWNYGLPFEEYLTELH